MVSSPLPPIVPPLQVCVVPVREIGAVPANVPFCMVSVAMLSVPGMLSVSVHPCIVMLPMPGVALLVTVSDMRNLQSALASARALLARAAVGVAGTAAADVEAAVALEIDRAAIGERGAVVKVAVVIARVIQRAGVADRSRVVIDVVIDRDRGRAGNGQQAAAAYRAARPRLCRSAERDRRSAGERSSGHRQRGYGKRRRAVER